MGRKKEGKKERKNGIVDNIFSEKKRVRERRSENGAIAGKGIRHLRACLFLSTCVLSFSNMTRIEKERAIVVTRKARNTKR